MSSHWCNQRVRRYRTLLLCAALSLISMPTNAEPTSAQSTSRTFPETGKTVKGAFLAYWESHGGLAQQGYPITDEREEVSPTDGKVYTVQYFERAIFEAHPENQPPYDVLLSLLGVFRYRESYPTGAASQRANDEPGFVRFPETLKQVGGAFLDHWRKNGGLAQNGYPISNELTEVSELDGKRYTMQYFERAVFEYHPENRPPYDVLLSQLGTLRLRQVESVALSRGSVRPTGEMGLPRACHSSTLLDDGRVLIAGGMQRDGVVTASAETFDPKTGKFISMGQMAEKRVCHEAVKLQDGRVIMIGGFGTELLASVETYDPATGRFAPMGSLLQKREGFTATLLKNGKILIAGGSSGEREWYSSAELYDPATGKSTPTGDMSVPRAAHTATLLNDGRVLIVGGSRSRTEVQASAEIYDPTTGSFSATGSMSALRHKHAATRLADGKVLVAGGSDSRDWRGRYASAELYDPAAGKFHATGSMTDVRFKSRDAIVSLGDGTILVAGGGRSVDLYDAQAGKFSPVEGQVDGDRFYTQATLLGEGRVLITGGYDYNIVSSAKAWIFERR